MDKDQELKNLDMMLSNGLISQKVYEVQKNLIMKKYPEHNNSSSLSVPKEKSPLTSISLIEAFKFSFRPIVFLYTLIFLLIGSILTIFTARIFFDPELLQAFMFMGPESISISLNIISMVLSLFLAVLESSCFTFFTHKSLEALGQKTEVIEAKKFLIKSLVYAGFFCSLGVIGFSLSLILSSALVRINFSSLSVQEQIFTFASIFMIALIFLLALLYISISVLIGLVGKFKTFNMVFFRALTYPRYIFISLGGMLLNLIVMPISILIIGGIIKLTINLSEDILSIFSFSTFILYLLLLAITFVMTSKKIRKIIMFSCLLVIPSFIILFMLPIPSFILTASFVFGYIAVMQLFFGLLYIGSFFTIQMKAFASHIITQVWCQVMDKKVIITYTNNLPQQPQETKENVSDTPPYIFR